MRKHESVTKRFHGQRYLFREDVLRLEDCDTDVRIELPNGDHILLQYRIETPSMDVIFGKDRNVICWKGEDMEPAPALDKKTPEVRFAGQLVIDLSDASQERQRR